MSIEKTEWVNLQVTMTDQLKNTVHRLCRTCGENASAWARNLIIDALPALAAQAERRERALLALVNGEEISPGVPRRNGVAKRPHAARRKARQAGGKIRR